MSRQCTVEVLRATNVESADESESHCYEVKIICREDVAIRYMKIDDAKKLGLSAKKRGPVDAWLYGNGSISLN
jgi:hypothetical protein